MTESRIPRDLVRAIAIEYIKESKRLGGEIDGLSNALDAHLDELAALVQPDQGGVWVVIAEEEAYGERKRVQVWAPNPDAALIDALAEAIAADDGRPLEDCADEVQEQYRGNARAVLAVLRERCDITPRGEQ